MSRAHTSLDQLLSRGCVGDTYSSADASHQHARTVVLTNRTSDSWAAIRTISTSYAPGHDGYRVTVYPDEPVFNGQEPANRSTDAGQVVGFAVCQSPSASALVRIHGAAMATTAALYGIGGHNK